MNQQLHPAVRLSYLPRIMTSISISAIIVSINHSGVIDYYLILVAAGLIWPHLAYFRGRASGDPGGAERFNRYVDSCFSGSCAAVAGFGVIPCLAFVFSSSVACMINGGIPHFVRSLLLTGTFAAATGLLTGYAFTPESSIPTIAIASIHIFLYISLVGYNTHRTGRQIRERERRIASLSRDLEAKVDELRRSEERYRSILENIKEGYFEVDRSGNVTFCNDSLCTISGYPRDEIVGKGFGSFMLADDVPEIYSTFNRIFTTGAPSEIFDWRFTRKNGTKGTAEGSASLIVDSSGRKTGFRGVLRDVTDRKESERMLRASEEKYRSILESIGEGYFEVDINGTLTFYNDAFTRVFEREGERLIGTPYGALMDQESARRVFVGFRNVLFQQAGDTLVDWEIVLSGGRRKYLSASVNILHGPDGKPAGFRGMVRDVTDRKRAEAALRESEEKYRSFVENATDGIFRNDLNGNFIFVNPAGLKLLGYGEDELLSMNYRSLVKEDHRERVLAAFREQLAGETGEIYIEFPVIRKNGEQIWVGQRVRLGRNHAGRPEFHGISRDITDLKRIETALRESEEHSRVVLDNISDVVFICNLKGRFIYVNPAMTRITGYAPEEILDRNYLHFIRHEYRDAELQSYIRQVREDIPETQHVYPFLVRDGGYIWIEQTARTVRRSDGEVLIYGVARDITEKKKAEDARRELEEQKSRFFANISHEIRTPLTLMLSPIESALQGDFEGAVDAAFLRGLYRNGLRLLKLINNLLDFSKIEAGRMMMFVQEVDIVRFIAMYVAGIQSAADANGVSISFEHETGRVDNLFIDPEKIDKVIMNLLSNALKFTPPGGAITVRLRDDEVYCYLEFEDTGCGIPADSLDRIFERFTQVDARSTRKYAGTGIGLALARELVEMHGGSIQVRSRYEKDCPDDHGTTFAVTLLKGREHFDASEYASVGTPSELREAVSDHRFTGMREMDDLRPPEPATHAATEGGDAPSILVVDDNPEMRDFLAALLSRDYRVRTAANGRLGIEAALRETPDLIVTDLMMPEMDGREMTGRIKTDDNLRQVPVIMITAKADIAQKIEGLEQGADDYLVKPFNSKELLARVRALLKTVEFQKLILKRNREVEEELEVARLLQQRLLPETALEVPGYATHAVYIPMDKVGGDFYDYRHREGVIELLIADVSGHGLPGAFLSTITKMANDHILDRSSPAGVLRALNEVARRTTVRSNFITAFLCMLDTGTGVLRYSSAGHVAPLVHRSGTGEFLELKVAGKPLGWFNDIRLDEQEIRLVPGDRLVLYTDGITECVNRSREMFGEERLRECIAARRAEPPRRFCDSLIGLLREFAGDENFDDDLTMVVFDVL